MISAGAAYMVASAFAFSVMSALVKLAGERLPSQELVLARAAVSLVLSWLLLRRARRSVWGERRGLLLVRGALGFLGLSAFYWSVTHLPIAEATVLQYTHPLFTALLAALFLGERLHRGLLGASLLGLAGVVIVARPAALFGEHPAALDPLAVGIALSGALFSAAAYVCVRRLSATEHPLVIVFYFPLVAVPASVPTVVPVAVWPQGLEWLLLLAIGVATQFGQVFLTQGLRREPAARATAVSYLQVVFAALWGVLLFGERLGALALVGAALVLAGSFAAARQRTG